jgi:TonB-dependent SusC/RagA subfamily outer membrane receptor
LTERPGKDDKEWMKKSLYVIDGTESSFGDIAKLEPGRIESITILKDKHAAALYGEKGKNGVIIIKTRPAGSKVQATMVIESSKDTLVADTIFVHN